MAAPDPTERYLIALDPVRGLRVVVRLVEDYAALDPKVNAAVTRLVEHVTALPSDDRDTVLAPVLWLQLRNQLSQPWTLDHLRAWLGDGELVLRTVEQHLDTTLAPRVLADLTREVAQLTTRDSGIGDQLSAARAELARLNDDTSVDVAPLVVGAACLAVVAGFALGVAIADYVHSHEHH